jgi:hypothetical protein
MKTEFLWKETKTVNKITSKKLAEGVIVFENALPMDGHDYVFPFISSLKEKAIKEDYVIIKDENGEDVYAINRSGHRYDIESIAKSSSHIMNFLDGNDDSRIEDFFIGCEQAFRQCLLEYISIYPMALPSIWWRTQGHILAYGPSSGMGLHSDNDVNYQPGFEPDLQVATRSVLGSILYFNSSVDSKEKIVDNEYVGGEIEFPYLGVKYSPKAGDLLMFPSNFIATHEVHECKEGNRYAYIGYYSQGSEHKQRGIDITSQSVPVGKQGQIWMPEVVEEYKEFVKENFDTSNMELMNKLLNPTLRTHNSANTQKEIHDRQ